METTGRFLQAHAASFFLFGPRNTVELVPLIGSAAEPENTLRAYASLYLQEEVQAEALVRNVGAFARFLEAISFSHGSLLNLAEVARECLIAQRLRAWASYRHVPAELFYWRTKSGSEVDFVPCGAHVFVTIEVKRSRNVHHTDLRSVKQGTAQRRFGNAPNCGPRENATTGKPFSTFKALYLRVTNVANWLGVSPNGL